MRSFEFEYFRRLFASASTMNEVAAIAGVSREFLYRLLRRGSWTRSSFGPGTLPSQR